MTKKVEDEPVGSYPWVLEDAYPEPEKIFAPYIAPHISELSVIVALDTNALLLPYRINPGNLKALGEVYKGLSDKKRLVVPARAAREYATLIEVWNTSRPTNCPVGPIAMPRSPLAKRGFAETEAEMLDLISQVGKLTKTVRE